MKLLIKKAQCVLPTGIHQANVLIEGKKIVSIDAPDHTSADETIVAEGYHLIPGVIDDQVHFRDPGATHKEDIYTGSLGCAKGGITTFLEMPNTNPTTTDAKRLLEKLERASQVSLVNYGFYLGATTENLSDLKVASRTPGIKIFIGSSTGSLLVDEQEALERIFAETALPICAHCEDEATVRANGERLGGGKVIQDHSKIRNHEAALIATKRALELAYRHNHRFHILHVSTRQEIPVLADHRNLITAEVCPHHLYFNIDDYDTLGSLVQMNPSIKEKADNEALWKALADGTILVVATDHAPHLLSEKAQPYPKSPSGLPAVENSLALMLDAVNRGKLSLERVVSAMCDAPARVWDMIGKGRIEVGYDADLVLVDMNREKTIHNADQVTRSGWSPWDGTTLKGWPVRTIVGGRTVYLDGLFDKSVRGQEVIYDHARGGYWATQ